MIVSSSISYYDTANAAGVQPGICKIDSASFLVGYRDVESTFAAIRQGTITDATGSISFATEYSGGIAVTNRTGAIQQPRVMILKMSGSYAVIFNDVAASGGPSVQAVTGSSGVYTFGSKATTTNSSLFISEQYRWDACKVNDTQIAIFGFSNGQENAFATPRYLYRGNRLYFLNVSASTSTNLVTNGYGTRQTAAFHGTGFLDGQLGDGGAFGIGLCNLSSSQQTSSLIGAWTNGTALFAQAYTWITGSVLANQFLSGSITTLASVSASDTEIYYNADPALVRISDNVFMWSIITGSTSNVTGLQVGIATVNNASQPTITPIYSASAASGSTNMVGNRLTVLSEYTTGDANDYATVLCWQTIGIQGSSLGPQLIRKIRVDNISPTTYGSVSMSFVDDGVGYTLNSETWVPAHVGSLTTDKFVTVGWGTSNVKPAGTFELNLSDASPTAPITNCIIYGLETLKGVRTIQWTA